MTDSSRPEYWDEPPPYRLRPGELAALFGERFTQTKNAIVSDSPPLLAGKENWQVWRKK